jgi:tetratricopeptide (TPR) repeat protein
MYTAELGAAYFFTGREAEALEHWRKTAEVASAANYLVKAEYYLWKGDYERAKELHSTAEKLDPNNPWAMWVKGYIAAKTGDRETAKREIQAIEGSKAGAVGSSWVGFICYALGDLDSYFDYQARALDLHAIDVSHMMYCPLFAEGRADPRYKELIEKLRRMSGLAE